MPIVSSDKAFYIKLGRSGMWEADSLVTGKLRFGWRHQSLDDINARRWDVIREQLREEHPGKPGVVTNDVNRLCDIVETGPEDIWLTFHQAKLWWTRVAPGPVCEDEVSRYRNTVQPWSDKAANGRLLIATELPGKLAQLQGYRGTVCRVHHRQELERVLLGVRSEAALTIAALRTGLEEKLTEAIRALHWKDFETLVDLIFRSTGWQRVSVLGQHAKGFDLELREPMSGDRYVVQVKSKAGLKDLEATVAQFSPEDYRTVFFAVHSPHRDLAAAEDLPEHVDLLTPERLAAQALEAGLVSWVEDRVS